MTENHIEDLLARFDSKERLPVPPGELPGSEWDVSWQAYSEAEKLNDISLLPQIEAQLLKAKLPRTFRGLATIIGCLAKNTGNLEVRILYRQLLEKAPQDRTTVMYLVQKAWNAGGSEYRDYVRKHLDSNYGPVLSEVIGYLGKVGHPDDLRAIGELLDADCNGHCHPMYCIFAFENNGHREGIPYIERAIERHKNGRKRFDDEIVGYGTSALAKLAS